MKGPKLTSGQLALALVAMGSLVIGWLLGGANMASSTSTASEPVEVSRSRKVPRTTQSSTLASEARRQVNAIRRADSSEERLRATIALALSIPTAELGEWVKHGWFDFRDGCELTIFNSIIDQRWKIEDPISYAKSISNPRRAAAIFVREVGSDPEKLSAFIKDSNNSSRARYTLEEIALKDPQLALELADKWDKAGALTDYSFSYILEGLYGQLAQSDPSLLRSQLQNMSPQNRLLAETTLLVHKMKNQTLQAGIDEARKSPNGKRILSEALEEIKNPGNRVLEIASSLPPGWAASIFKRNEYLLVNESNAKRWYEADLESWGFSESDASNARHRALRELARKDPEWVLSHLGSYSTDDPLSSRKHESLISSVFAATNGEQDKFDSLLALLETDEARTIAEEYRPSEASDTLPAPKTPDQWMSNALASSDDSSRLRSALRDMTSQQIEELTQNFRSLGKTEKDQLFKKVGTNFYGRNHELPFRAELITHAVDSPDLAGGSEKLITYSTKVVTNWTHRDPVAAQTWADSLPAGDTQQWVRRNLALNWHDYDPQAANQWIESLPSDTQTDLNAFIANPEGFR